MRRALVALVVSCLWCLTGCCPTDDASASLAVRDHLRLAGARPAAMGPALAAADFEPPDSPAPRSDAVNDASHWFRFGALALANDGRGGGDAVLAQGPSADPAAGGSTAARDPAPAAEPPPTAAAGVRVDPATGRREFGPAYPGDFWRSFGRYGKDMPASLWDDTKATATNPWALAGLAAAGAAGIALCASDADDCTADHYTERGSQLPQWLEQVGDVGGNPGAHFAVAGAWLLTSIATDDVKNYENARTMINALAINGVVTLALKGIVRTESPNGEDLGWPSGHTSSTFTVATVLNEQYGPWVGIPAFAFAAFVGYERVDARNHDLSDVVSGALMGMAIGYAVAHNHETKLMGMDIVPYPTPSGAGIALTKSW